MQKISDSAIVLGAIDYQDSDRILNVLCQHTGRVSLFVAGARKSKKRFSGALELGNLLRVQMSTARHDNFRLESADIENAFLRTRESLEKMAMAMVSVDFVKQTTRELEPNGEIFASLKSYLEWLNEAPTPALARLLSFAFDVVALAGFALHFERCHKCGKPVEEAAPLFDFEVGCVLHAECGRVTQRVSRIGNLFQSLARVSRGEVELNVRIEALQFVNHYISVHTGHGLKSLEFLRQVV